MKVSFLGTGTSQGIPVIANDHPVGKSNDPKDKRLRSSVMVSWGQTNIAIDCSADFRQQMLRHSVQNLEAILFTHEHADHTAGLDDIRPFVFKQGDMPIYGLKRVIDQLKQRFEYIFRTENRYPGAPSVQSFEIDKTHSLELFGKKIIPIEVWHGTLPILGYRIENLTYITDAKFIHEEELEKLVGTQTLIINALRKNEHPTHWNLEQAIKIAERINARQTFLTHISQDMGFHRQVEAQLPKNIFLAYDDLVVDV